MAKKKARRGPEPERVKIEGDWEKAVEKAVHQKRPKGGWPKPKKGQKKDEPEDSSSSS